MSAGNIERLFPNLRSCGYTITSEANVGYNCIAWAAEDNDKWWWPDAEHTCYWPENIPRDETLDAFVKAYQSLGYTVCSNQEYEHGVDRIAIYTDNKDTPTHVARQLESGRWTSKLGQIEDIEHNTLTGFNGSSYGHVAVIMKRPRRSNGNSI